jgi:hypothetical protein
MGAESDYFESDDGRCVFAWIASRSIIRFAWFFFRYMIIAFAILGGLVLAVINLLLYTRESRQRAAPVQPASQDPAHGGNIRQKRAGPLHQPKGGDLRVAGCQSESLSALMGHWILEIKDKCNGKAYYYRPTRTRTLYLYCSESGKEWKVRSI